ncbi:MAG: SPFH domain-containing protein [Clostridia bacterium]
MSIFFIILIVLVFIVAFASIKVVRQSEVRIIERFGKYNFTADAGLNFILPFVDKVRAIVSLKQQTMDVTPQSVITKDNVTITIDTVVFYQITEPVKAVYEIESLQKGIAYIAITTIRDIVGKMDLDSTFSSRDQINVQLRDVLDEATDKWGCKVDRVEIKDIKPPVDIRDAMEKQMNAERNKRANILEAEGKRQADITLAEGRKQATILNAEAERESSIRRAQGIREAKMLEAEGSAEAIKKVADAKAKEINLVYTAIMDAKPDANLVAIKSLEALESISQGSANKVFIPFDATKAMGALGAATEILKDNPNNIKKISLPEKN